MREKAGAALKRLTYSPKRSITLVMMLLIWAGVTGAMFAAISYDLRSKDFLRGRAETIAAALPATSIEELDGSAQDLNSPSYNDLKDRLQLIRSNNSDARFIYLMGKEDDKVFFFVDSESPNTRDYSPPGQIYDEASGRLKAGFGTNKAFIEGPTRDRWGLWMSALAPVVDPATDEVIALVGMDVSAVDYYSQLAAYAAVPLLLAAIPLAGLLRDIKLASKQWELMQLKNQFVSIASHELRSPLNGLLWGIQAVLKSPVAKNKTEHELLEDMYRSAEASLVTVNEILDFSIFDRGHADKLQHEKIDLVSVIKDVASTLRLGAKEKGLELKFSDAWPNEVFTMGDVGALKRAFMNIVSNAIKYSPEDSAITFLYESKDTMHVIGVRDHGIGIPTDEQAKVLEGYYRATNATKVQAHGTGLGLWVTRLIVEKHGGALRLKSETGKGTTIYASFPALTPKDKTVNQRL